MTGITKTSGNLYDFVKLVGGRCDYERQMNLVTECVYYEPYTVRRNPIHPVNRAGRLDGGCSACRAISSAIPLKRFELLECSYNEPSLQPDENLSFN